MSNYSAIKAAIAEHVVRAKIAGTVVDAEKAARQLSSKYPQSGLTINEIVADIEKMAAHMGAALLSGATPKVSGSDELKDKGDHRPEEKHEGQ